MGHSEGRGKSIAIQAYLKNTETFQINNLTLHLKEMEGSPGLPAKMEA